MILRCVPACVALSVLSACASTNVAPDDGISSAAATPVSDADIMGGWDIIRIGRTRAPQNLSVTFRPNGIGTHDGCNSHFGTGVLASGRYYTGYSSITLLACQPSTREGRRKLELGAKSAATLFSDPTITRKYNGNLLVTAGKTRLELRRQQDDGQAEPEPGAPENLAGQNLDISRIDNDFYPGYLTGDTRLIQFGADRFTAKLLCGTVSGAWRQDGNAILFSDTTLNAGQNCPDGEAEKDAKLAALMRGRAKFAGGAGAGNFIMAGNGHSLIGSRARERD